MNKDKEVERVQDVANMVAEIGGAIHRLAKEQPEDMARQLVAAGLSFQLVENYLLCIARELCDGSSLEAAVLDAVRRKALQYEGMK